MANYFSDGINQREFRYDAMNVLEHVHTLEVDEMCDAIQGELGITDQYRDQVEAFVMEQISLAISAS